MRFAVLVSGSWLAAWGSLVAAAAPIDFARDVRPLLSNSCFACHGADEKARKANLRLDVRDAAVKAEAVVPGKPDVSELIRRLTAGDPAERMPPGKSKKPALDKKQIELLTRWIAEGAKYAEHWSFAKLTRPPVPVVEGSAWVHNPVDAFILHRLRNENISPNVDAEGPTLLRRLSFDLTGLPPTPADVRAFRADPSPKAYENAVDRLLASPHFGERMAVWWLDLVRYADTIGYHSDNPMNVSPYRDYVIRSFNENKSFDAFTIEQLAGDLLPNATREQKVASAYNRLLQTTEEGGAQAKEYEAKYAADRVRNYAQVWLGATLMCAECHDHKFDPYTQKDFYSVAAFFADVQEPSVGRREAGMPIATPAQEAEIVVRNEAVSAAWKPFKAAAAEYKKDPAAAKVLNQAALAVLKSDPLDRIDETRVKALADFVSDKAPKLQPHWKAVEAALQRKAAFGSGVPRVLVTRAGPPRTVRILPRGNWLDSSGPVTAPATPAFLPALPKTVGRPTRLDLARWTVAAANPLAARVAANRIWKLFFGRGLSRSPEESGTQGDPPSHPELLDWLAAEFQDGWDVKQLVRLLVTSNAYRQSSVESPALRETDPLNRLFARQNRFRLDAEFVRDHALAVSGLLVPEVGGPSAKPYQPAGYWSALNFPVREWQMDSGSRVYRRGLYTHWQRTFPHPAMLAFDATSREECTCERPRSNIPQQALVLLNDPEFVEAARVLAGRMLTSASSTDHERIGELFARATGRRPSSAEANVLAGLLAKHRKDFAADEAGAKRLVEVGPAPRPTEVSVVELAAWTSLARVVLNLHESVTRQ